MMLLESFPAAIKNGSRFRNIVLVCLILSVITSAVYLQVGDSPFLSLDDEPHIMQNTHVAEGLTSGNIVWAFTCVDTEYWHPVVWLSHMADVQLFGMNPRGHHLTNVVIHIIDTTLLFILLIRMTGAFWQCAFVAALFALHPTHVEAVAWVTERKDVLSAFFWFCTLLAYCGFVAKQRIHLYFLALLFFVLGLMSKPMLVTLPVVMLLLDFWPLGRLSSHSRLQLPGRTIGQLVSEKIPFFACSIGSAILTVYSHDKAGAINRFDYTAFVLCIENAFVAYVKYIGKTLWPQDLAIVYPFPLSIPVWEVISSVMILLLITVAAIKVRHRHPYLVVGWFWFLITLIPVIGLIKAGLQVEMADRFSYIPGIGLYVMGAWGIPALAGRLKQRKIVLGSFAGTVVILSAALTYHQLGYWKDGATLYRHALSVTTNNSRVNILLGSALVSSGDYEGAFQAFQEVLWKNPYDGEAHYALGIAYYSKGDLDAAIQEFKGTLALLPDYKDTHNKLGVALARTGDMDSAIREFREELRKNPDNMDADKNLKKALADR